MRSATEKANPILYACIAYKITRCKKNYKGITSNDHEFVFCERSINTGGRIACRLHTLRVTN